VTASQVPAWRDFYEAAWAYRAEFMRSKIRGGETDPYRIIKLFEAHERKYSFTLRNGESIVERKTWPRDIYGETPAGVPMLRGTSLRGEILRVPFHARDHLHDFIIDYIDENGPYDCILELGCGYGRALFEIFYGGGPSNIPYFGGELTKSGVAIAQELAALRPDMKATFFAFDHLQPDLGIVPRVDRALVYTMHSIEQVALIDQSFFAVAAGIAKDVTGLHFEPFGYQLGETGPVTKDHKKFMLERGWNQNFAVALAQAMQRYGLNSDFTVTEQFLPADWQNPTSLTIWRSAAA
jgi:SAM-dependent methyltransferase